MKALWSIETAAVETGYCERSLRRVMERLKIEPIVFEKKHPTSANVSRKHFLRGADVERIKRERKP